MSQPDAPAAQPARVGAILLAAGASVRVGFDKVWADLAGRPLIAWPLEVLAHSARVHELVVVVRAGAEDRMRSLLADLRVDARVVVGGERRQDSVAAGLGALSDVEWVVVHDGARPMLTEDLVDRGLEAAQETGAALAAVPAVDTIKVVVAGRVVDTPPRERLWAAQTPQVFRRSLLVEAQRLDPSATDDAALVEALGVEVRVYEGAYGNIKVTSETDLHLVRLALQARAPERAGCEIPGIGWHPPQ